MSVLRGQASSSSDPGFICSSGRLVVVRPMKSHQSDVMAWYLQVPPQVPISQLKAAPLYTLVSGTRAPPPMTIGEGLLSQRQQPLQLYYNVVELMRQECKWLVEQKMMARSKELEDLLRTRDTCPGFVRVHSVLWLHCVSLLTQGQLAKPSLSTFFMTFPVTKTLYAPL